MQSTYKLKLTPEQLELLQHENSDKIALLTDVIQSQGAQIAFMLQLYYSREKVSKVMVAPGTITFTSPTSVTLKLEYVMEEFNACSAIDTEKKEQMTVSAELNIKESLFNLKGEYWAERDPD